jgi:hypothetical protein
VSLPEEPLEEFFAGETRDRLRLFNRVGQCDRDSGISTGKFRDGTCIYPREVWVPPPDQLPCEFCRSRFESDNLRALGWSSRTSYSTVRTLTVPPGVPHSSESLRWSSGGQLSTIRTARVRLAIKSEARPVG